MSFRVHERQEANALGRDPTVCVLDDGRGTGLRVWPALGFNAYHWAVNGQDLLYRDPNFFNELKPTRSGFPVLFPFPNRIRDGRFTWDRPLVCRIDLHRPGGEPDRPEVYPTSERQTYQLPLNDPAGKNAIHGFAAYRPWRVIDRGGNHEQAWLTGEFHGSRDAADAAHLWPCDYRIRLTYRLFKSRLRVETVVDDPDRLALPFGLGYHPYFRVAPFGGPAAQVSLFVRGQWDLHETLPTGKKQEIAPQGDIRFADTQLDDLYTDVERLDDDTVLLAALHCDGGPSLRVTASRDFRELVAFTPPQREAICFEPYTCATDAINLQQHGIDAGLRVLAPGERWNGWVEATLDLGN